jgi:hypothetical protein
MIESLSKDGSPMGTNQFFQREAFRAGAVDVTATASGEGGVEGLQIPF